MMAAEYSISSGRDGENERSPMVERIVYPSPKRPRLEMKQSKPQAMSSIIADAAVPYFARRAAATAIYHRPSCRHVLYKKRPNYKYYRSTEGKTTPLDRLPMMIAFQKLVEAKNDMICEHEYMMARAQLLFVPNAEEKALSELWNVVKQHWNNGD
eukprot:scaffold9032_cov67-Skeletonema_dohrnii-CCMP3373.AAC.1